jgi:predicted dinucleotide-binding enzyme
LRPVLILGGYGGFGSRLARRLSADGFPVLVAGRSLAKAEAFAQTLPGARGIAADRSGDLRALLEQVRPALVVDAAGPFQNGSHSLAEQVVASGSAYLDIADDRKFVTGIRALDAAAREHGIAVISGASSVPALSGAVVRALAEGMGRVQSCDIAISASSRAAAGLSVSSAILAGAGQQFGGWDGGRPRQRFGWGRLGRERFDLAGGKGLGTRLVAEVEVPDLALLPEAYPDISHVRFRAGTESRLATAALWLLALFVRFRLIRSLLPLAPLLNRVQRLTAWWGGDRSGMVVRLVGRRNGTAVERRWTLVADHDDGPEIPLLAAQLLVRRMLADQTPPGARPASDELALADFEPLFADLHVRHAISETALPLSLYRRVLGESFAELSPVLQRIHDPGRQSFARGRAAVTRGRSLLARIAAVVVGMPPEGGYPLHVTMDAGGTGERWTRSFGRHRFASHLSARNGRLIERFGALRFHFDLPVENGGLSMVLRRWSVLGLPMPLALGPQIKAREWEEAGRFHLDVAVSLPIAGLVVRYRGWLAQPDGSHL